MDAMRSRFGRRRDGRRVVKKSIAALVWASCLLAGIVDPNPVVTARALAIVSGPNVVFVLSDDQRADTLAEMPRIQRALVKYGVRFRRAHVVMPMCCPARASILTGNFAHTTGVWGNRGEHGGYGAFDDSTTLATALQGAGYRTGLFGKYLNGYGEDDNPTYVPPGWDAWNAILTHGKDYYSYTLNENGLLHAYGNTPEDYLTDVLFTKASDFAGQAMDDGQPFFAFITPTAPHAYAIPEREYAHDYDRIAPWRPDSYNERDMSDKPAYSSRMRPLTVNESASIDRFRQRQYETLESVDEDTRALLNQIRAAGQLENTVFIYTSDNGYLWGEHRMDGKNLPYEEATRVPLVIRYQGTFPHSTNGELATNIDFAPTILELAGAQMATDGVSLVSYMKGEATFPRTRHLIESMGGPSIPPWCMLQTGKTTFTHYATGEEEYYNLEHDPLQLTNTVREQARSKLLKLRSQLRSMCTPLPPGMAPW
jgi:arylsulfatase A-like enzyme